MYKGFSFKGLKLEPGDIVAMVATSFPFEFQAAVIDYDQKKDTLRVMSTQLVITQHSGLFPASDVKAIELMYKYDKGVPMGARGNLRRGQLCLVKGGEESIRATVTAAFDGVVTGSVVDTPGVVVAVGMCVTGGSSHWKPL